MSFFRVQSAQPSAPKEGVDEQTRSRDLEMLIDLEKSLEVESDKMQVFEQFFNKIDSEPSMSLNFDDGTEISRIRNHEFLRKNAVKHATLLAEKHKVDLEKEMLRRLNLSNIGSGPGGIPLTSLLCCNVDTNDPKKNCTKIALFQCTRCYLHGYCSKECQRIQWSIHKNDCLKSEVTENWIPNWEREMRAPSFLEGPDENISTIFTGPSRKIDHLYGNVPAMDLLRLQPDEKKNKIEALFVASGDLRDLVYSVNHLEDDFDQTIHFHLNDINQLVMARNLCFLLLLLSEDDEVGDLVVELVLHAWYSIALTGPQKTYLAKRLAPFLTTNDESWQKSTMELILDQDILLTVQEPMLFRYMIMRCLINQIDIVHSTQCYLNVMKTMERIDYRHRLMLKMPPYQRLGWFDHRQFGLLLPFGSLNAHFNETNPFMFDPDDDFTMNDCSDPLHCWNLEEICESGKKAKVTKNDLYGALFFHVRDMLIQFQKKARTHKIQVTLSCMEATKLMSKLKHDSVKYDRIWLSNIGDSNYVGIPTLLEFCKPVIKMENPHHAVIGLFMNWIGTVGNLFKYPAFESILEKRMKEKAEKFTELFDFSKIHTFTAFCYPDGSDVEHCNLWPEFKRWLGEQFQKTNFGKGWILNERTKVVPRRFGVQVNDDSNRLPYLNTAWSRTSVEFLGEWQLSPE